MLQRLHAAIGQAIMPGFYLISGMRSAVERPSARNSARQAALLFAIGVVWGAWDAERRGGCWTALWQAPPAAAMR